MVGYRVAGDKPAKITSQSPIEPDFASVTPHSSYLAYQIRLLLDGAVFTKEVVPPGHQGDGLTIRCAAYNPVGHKPLAGSEEDNISYLRLLDRFRNKFDHVAMLDEGIHAPPPQQQPDSCS
jgi:hypothetical protein